MPSDDCVFVLVYVVCVFGVIILEGRGGKVRDCGKRETEEKKGGGVDDGATSTIEIATQKRLFAKFRKGCLHAGTNRASLWPPLAFV